MRRSRTPSALKSRILQPVIPTPKLHGRDNCIDTTSDQLKDVSNDQIIISTPVIPVKRPPTDPTTATNTTTTMTTTTTTTGSKKKRLFVSPLISKSLGDTAENHQSLHSEPVVYRVMYRKRQIKKHKVRVSPRAFFKKLSRANEIFKLKDMGWRWFFTIKRLYWNSF